jgi:hypothetical protein
MPRHFNFRKCTVLLVSLSVILSSFVLKASIRGPGKYSGVVIFDRWDTCLLLSGVYLTYISKDLKENLRAYKNQAVQIDASEVTQPMNPGDGSIRRFTILGPAPDTIHDGAIDAVRIEVQSDFVHDRAIAFSIKIENSGQHSIQINTDEIGPTILGPRVYRPFSSAADGGSMAWITRATLLQPTSWTATVQGRSFSAAYSPDSSTILPEHFNLAPRASKRVKVTFALPPGPYEFLVGFGGGVHEGKSIASNAITFHVEADGTPVLDD